MSYEGYVQYVCVNGHYECRDCYDILKKCSTCKERFVLKNDVDQTNDNGWRDHTEIELALEAREKRGFDNCLKAVVAWLRQGYKHDQAIADKLEAGEWPGSK